MEAFGAVASAAQLAATVNGILHVVREVCDELKKGPQRIRERVQYLDSLVSTLHLIRNIEPLQCSEVTSQLEAIGDKVRLLRGCLHKNSRIVSKKPLRRVWGALVSIKDEDTICETLIAIEYDKNSLILSISAISAKATHHIAHWNWTRMDSDSTEEDEAREALGRTDRAFPSFTQGSSGIDNQLIKRKPLSGMGPAIQPDPRQAGLGVDPQATGYSSFPNTQDPRQQSQSQKPAQQSPAAAFAARVSPERKGDVSVGNIVVGPRGTFSRGNIANTQKSPERDRTFIGDVDIREDAHAEDQNWGQNSPNNAKQQNQNEPSDASQPPRGQGGGRADRDEGHRGGGGYGGSYHSLNKGPSPSGRAQR